MSRLEMAKIRGQANRTPRRYRGWLARRTYWGWLLPLVDKLDGRRYLSATGAP